ncbi:hypothetical protein CEQ90_06085 [Lewinellaceae bacterium SD302]|nr:hypothetical protein CEQ90_06085 [Lewinellaceae bacterium SD302]
MKLRFTFLLLCAALTSAFIFTACDDDEDAAVPSGDVTVNFNALYDGANLTVQSDVYDYPDGSELKVQLFQYYVSDLELIPANGGDAVQLSDILLVRYNNAQEDNVDSYEFNEIPAGEYTGIRYGLGVSPDLNSMDPNEFDADFVLNDAEFWPGNARYVFAKIEATVDLENDGTFDTGVSYHMGSNDIYSTVTFNAPITVSENGNTTLDIMADVQKALAASDTDFHDFSDESQRIVHGGNQAVAADIWERLGAQFTLSVR